MTTTVTQLTTRTLLSNSYDGLSTTIGIAVIGILALLLLTREFAPLLRGSAPRDTRALDMAILPLLIVFAMIVIARMAELLK
jgi:hypothetical protein